ncbi:hypothetical protein [Fundidesulfovibrio putealis]|uniref:hypothetical protein n=1 Tax=Fundidesulfovibrio putealis TaxID=270496 RepID=UPI00146FA65B|nr:hypothetical protein [Fundidesulfovibrio putealis]
MKPYYTTPDYQFKHFCATAFESAEERGWNTGLDFSSWWDILLEDYVRSCKHHLHGDLVYSTCIYIGEHPPQLSASTNLPCIPRRGGTPVSSDSLR